jgi:hypothetical protein
MTRSNFSTTQNDFRLVEISIALLESTAPHHDDDVLLWYLVGRRESLAMEPLIAEEAAVNRLVCSLGVAAPACYQKYYGTIELEYVHDVPPPIKQGGPPIKQWGGALISDLRCTSLYSFSFLPRPAIVDRAFSKAAIGSV